MKKVVILVLLLSMLCAIALTLVSCGEPKDDGARISVYLGSEISDFDPTDYYVGSNAEQMLSLLFDPLFAVNEKGKLKLDGAADSYDVDKEDRKIVIELKDLIKVKDSYTDLAERDPGEHWYDGIKLPSSISKKGKKNHTARLDELTIKHFEAYLASSDIAVTDKAAKQEKARVYVNGLLEKGGPSTDVFKKSIGEAKTRELFENILFGTKH